MASSAARRGVPPTAGVGWSSRASSSALGAGAVEPAADRRGEVRDRAEHRDLGIRATLQVGAARAERVDDRVDDEAVLAGVLRRRGQRQQRLVAVGDGRAGDRPRLDDVTGAAHEELGARADEAVVA